jgi:hypothetical protein
MSNLTGYRVPDLYAARTAADLLVRLGVVPDLADDLHAFSNEVTAELETR